MKTLFTLLFFGIVLSCVSGQDATATVQAEIARLNLRQIGYQDSVKKYQALVEEANMELALLEKRLGDAKIVDQVDRINAVLTKKPVAAENFLSCKLLATPDVNATSLTTVKQLAKVKVLGLENKRFYKVKYKDKIGYIVQENLSLISTPIGALDKQLGELLSPAPKPSTYQYTPSSTPTYNYTPSSTQTSGTSSGTYTGPRGGKYYYTSSGKKRYYSQNKKH